jgi:hypothetical protein
VGGSCIILCCNHRSDRLMLDVGVCSSFVSGFAALEGFSSYLFVSVFLFCFVLFL